MARMERVKPSIDLLGVVSVSSLLCAFDAIFMCQNVKANQTVIITKCCGDRGLG